jgi:hypothetical protein
MFTPHPDDLDLDRLHTNIDKLRRGAGFARGEGQTVARIYMMAGEVELGDGGNQYIYIAEAYDHARMLGRDFLVLVQNIYPQFALDNENQSVRTLSPTLIILPNGQTYHFLSVDGLTAHEGYALRGRTFAKIFYDVSDEKEYSLRRANDNLREALDYLYSTGAEFI